MTFVGKVRDSDHSSIFIANNKQEDVPKAREEHKTICCHSMQLHSHHPDIQQVQQKHYKGYDKVNVHYRYSESMPLLYQETTLRYPSKGLFKRTT